MRHFSITSFLSLGILGVSLNAAPETLRLPLSGKGPSDAVEWDFRISSGRRAGEQATIPVPSQWEQHGFGDYDYGMVPAAEKRKEDGLYQRGFVVPEAWRGLGVRIVFDGSMTDTTVKINGKPAGPTHQGGFYRFHYDITDKIRFGGENRLEVLVSKDSANPTVEEAERKADYWVFGGIYRPVWLEARPPQSIEWTAIDAKANGAFRALVHLAGKGNADRVAVRVIGRNGTTLGRSFEAPVKGDGPVELGARIPDVLPWSAEEPNLYKAEFVLLEGGKVIHKTEERIGFRSLEIREKQGVFVNGRRITVKGVNRHCFRSKTGRALDPQDGIDDLKLIKSMNMNAVRCSHYPPDKAFLEACDEMGIYVINELCTWHRPVLDTPTARRLIGQMIRRDVNHPSILWWSNGNEGGWNTEVDGDFALWDIQKRPVLHPYVAFSGFQTMHYPDWAQLQKNLAGKLLVMPTEFLHGLFDGGHAAGLEDYWNAITSQPHGVGGFLWALADEGIARSDRGGEIDNWGTWAPDGIVGPNHEKEASYHAIRDIFSPVQIGMKTLPAGFDGRIEVSNKYDERNLSTCGFVWRLARLDAESAAGGPSGMLHGPSVEPGGKGSLRLPLPADWKSWDLLELTAMDREERELWTWSWPVKPAAETRLVVKSAAGVRAPMVTEGDEGRWKVVTRRHEYQFDRESGRLLNVRVAGKALPLANGPRLVGIDPNMSFTASRAAEIIASGAQPGNGAANAIDGSIDTAWSCEGRDAWIQMEFREPVEVDAMAISWQKAGERTAMWALDLSNDGEQWSEALRGESRKTDPLWDGSRFPLRTTKFARLRSFGNDQNAWNSILEWKIGRSHDSGKTSVVTLKKLDSGACRIETASKGPLESFAWTVSADGRLALEYTYRIDEPVVLHGVSFDLPEREIRGFAWTGQGPERVWANRMRGIRFGKFENEFRKLRPGIDFDYPHGAGYFAAVREASVSTGSGTMKLSGLVNGTFVRIGTNDEGEFIRTYWPEGDFSLLHAIPGIGNKLHSPQAVGPQGSPLPAPGRVSGTVTFEFIQ